MKKIFFPLLLTAALLLSACGTNVAKPTATPTTAPTTAPTAQSETTGSEEAAPTIVTANEENPCIPFSLMDQMLTTPYPGLPDVTADDWVLGPRNAPVSFMVYSEPQCPYCAQIDPILEVFQALYPEDVNVVFRYRPFVESFHDKSILASQAMEAAGMQGKFDEFRKWIFERQSKNPNNPNVANLADSEFWAPVAPDQLDEWLAERVSELGIDPDQLIEDMFSDAVVEKIAAAQASADQLAINGTPSLFLNGYQWPENSRGVGIFSIYTELLLKQRDEYPTCPQMVIDTSKSYSATIETTQGNIELELFDDVAPYAVNSFLFLINEGYYDDLPFIITAEFALSGDPSDTGYGGPGYAFKDEVSADYNLSEPGMLTTYALGPGLNGSSFLINKTALESQEGRTIFGRVTEGMDVVNSLVLRNDIFAPVEDKIIKITITES